MLKPKNFNLPQDILNAGWVLLRFDLDSMMWIGRDELGNRWEIEEVPSGTTLVYTNGLTLMRAKPEELRAAGAVMIPRGNVSDNRR